MGFKRPRVRIPPARCLTKADKQKLCGYRNTEWGNKGNGHCPNIAQKKLDTPGIPWASFALGSLLFDPPQVCLKLRPESGAGDFTPSSHASRVRRLKPHLLATPAWVSPSFSRAALIRWWRLAVLVIVPLYYAFRALFCARSLRRSVINAPIPSRNWPTSTGCARSSSLNLKTSNARGGQR